MNQGKRALAGPHLAEKIKCYPLETVYCPDLERPVNRLLSAHLLNLFLSEARFELFHKQCKVSEMMEMIGSGNDGHVLSGVLGLCHNVMGKLDIPGDNLSGVSTDLSASIQCQQKPELPVRFPPFCIPIPKTAVDLYLVDVLWLIVILGELVQSRGLLRDDKA